MKDSDAAEEHMQVDPDQRKQDWAESRTDWAEDRTLLANERTFAGWLRTGFASVAVAIGLQAVFGSFQPLWAAKAVATGFILVALAVFWAAWRNARKTHARMSSHRAKTMTGRRFGLLAGMSAIASALVAGTLWLI